MTQDEALAYLDSIIAQVNLTRAQHVRAIEAIKALKPVPVIYNNDRSGKDTKAAIERAKQFVVEQKEKESASSNNR